VQIRNFGNQLLNEVQAIPGVNAAALLGGRALLRSRTTTRRLNGSASTGGAIQTPWSAPTLRSRRKTISR
jgi:hypothetical protein